MMNQRDHMPHPKIDGRHVVIHTDGSCIGNPGPGGWAAILSSWDGDRMLGRRPISGGECQTTNNRMEMTAAIKGLEEVKRKDRPIIVKTDSQIIVKGMTEWLPGWKKRGWKNSSGKPVENRDLWEHLVGHADRHGDVRWEWVRGHAGDPLNEKADRLANEAARGAMRGLFPPIGVEGGSSQR